MPTTEYHASAHDDQGRSVPEPIWTDMDQYADFRTLPEARDWATKTLAADARVSHVQIRESVQEYKGGYWKAGRHTETVSRPSPVSDLLQHLSPATTPAPTRAAARAPRAR